MAHLFPALARPSDRLAVAVGDQALTWAELARACAGHIDNLRAQGVESGARVAIWARPTLGTVVAMVGNLMHGVVTVPLNPKLGPKEHDHILATAEPALVLDDPDISMAEPRALSIEVDDLPALIIFTSGTTGAPKGAVLTVRNIVTCLDGLIDAWSWTSSDVVAHALPIFHVHGLVLGLLGSLRVGGGMRLLPRFSAEAVIAAFAAGATMLFAVPTMYHRMADEIGEDERLASSLRAARMTISGSAALAGRDSRILREHGIEVHQRYGLTETLINSAARYGQPVADGTVGAALSGIEIRIVGDGRDGLAPDSIGEVAVRGDNVFPGYLGNPEATAAVVDKDGWFYTGDLGEMNAAGLLTIHGRKSTDLIKTGGYKVGAGEVEACLLDRAEVAEVAVVGAPDDDLGERIIAFVVASGDGVDADALIQWVAGQLSPHKRPREIRLVSELPRNAMGKVQKRRLLGGG